MAMREKIVAMKDDDIKAGVEEAKELEAENAPCTIAVLLFSKMLAASLTKRVATETKKTKRKNTAAVLRRGTGLLQLGCANTCAFRSRVCNIAVQCTIVLSSCSRELAQAQARAAGTRSTPRQRPTRGTSSRATVRPEQPETLRSQPAGAAAELSSKLSGNKLALCRCCSPRQGNIRAPGVGDTPV